MELIIDQVKKPQPLWKKLQEENVPAAVAEMMEKNVEEHLLENPIVLNTLEALNARGSNPEQMNQCMVNLQKINDIRYINKFFESVNRALPVGGCFVGCVEPSAWRKERLMKRLPGLLNKIVYPFDYLLTRVWPKLPFLKKSYFALTKGKNRVISEMETYGRLYSCGFRLLDTVADEGKLYFAVEKTGEPDYNEEATYGPFIILRRVGKNGKPLKVYKMRTMSPYSEYVQQFIYERNGAGGIGTGSKFNNDPRITTVGKFMRKYWIDELPMLYNLLRGDLKIFGIRPISKHYFSLFPEDFQEYRKNFKPGLVPPVYVEIPKSLKDTVDIERRYLQLYEQKPFWTDISYTVKAFYNIFIKRIRSC